MKHTTHLPKDFGLTIPIFLFNTRVQHFTLCNILSLLSYSLLKLKIHIQMCITNQSSLDQWLLPKHNTASKNKKKKQKKPWSKYNHNIMGVKTNMVCYTPRYSKCKRLGKYVMILDIGKTLYQTSLIFNTKVHTNLPRDTYTTLVTTHQAKINLFH